MEIWNVLLGLQSVNVERVGTYKTIRNQEGDQNLPLQLYIFEQLEI